MIESMHFSGTWRDYQARVLEEMEDHLDDDRLHVVAAPGAGKTVLGLEIVRQLGRPALVFAPSVAIRDQWRERLVPLFMPSLPGSDAISRDLSAPRDLTLATYQSLDSYRRKDDLSALIDALNKAGPFTLVLDEAHHLRKAWWECLDRLANELEDVRIVALTATPPYDASFAEWRRYERLCGPIDLEIGIPELVRNGDLCPHHDHLILSEPTEDALELLNRRREAISALQSDLRADKEILDMFAAHPWVADPEGSVEKILDAPEMLSAIMVLLGSAGRPLPHDLLDLLGVSARDLPMPSQFWLERLLDGLLFEHAEAFPLDPDYRKQLERRLHRHGLIEGKRVRLQHTRSVFRLLSSSLAKLESIQAIARAEQASLGDDLRMVVLTDHIRAGEMPRSPESEFKPAKLGVVPIFESLRRANIASEHLGVLTGSIIIVPRVCEAAIDAILPSLGLGKGAVRSKALKSSPDHIELQAKGSGDLVRLVTELFQQGHLKVLIGTQSLLGQGWDAPALNSLVLASNTASFMLSNQMRGRAIRIDPTRAEKVANIWHLATVDPAANGFGEALEQSMNWGMFNDRGTGGLTDIGIVARRFKAFEGISNGESNLIESGIARLYFDPSIGVAQLNAKAMHLANDRQAIAEKWSISLGEGEARSPVREVAASDYAPRTLSTRDTMHALVWSAGGAGLTAAASQLTHVTSLEGLATLGTIAAGIGTLATLPRLAKAMQLLWRNGSLEGSLQQATRAILAALVETGHINLKDLAGGTIQTRTSVDGRRDVTIKGLKRATERMAIESLAELLGPVQNPRYMLVRKSWLGVAKRADYHAVPTVLATHKDSAEIFAKYFRAYLGSSDLVFTRSAEGRRILLRARMRSFASGFQRSVDRRSAWL